MRKFETKEVTLLKARETVEQLYIDDIGVIEAFEQELKGSTYLSELKTILGYVQHFADGNSCGSRMKYVKNAHRGGTEYEFISKHLRLYAFQQPGKKIIIFIAKKKKADSSDNIRSFQLLKEQFLQSMGV
jgi:hypothetical protein